LNIIGKTNTPEFGLSPVTEPEALGPTRNPWDVTRTSGGSSGGSAAAVAAGMVPIAHGSDGAGSLRIPAAYCGVFGLKPSRGRTPIGPYFVRVWQGMVIEHVLTRSVRDSAAMLDVLSGPELGSPISLPKSDVSFLESINEPPRKLRIGLIEHPFFPAQIDEEYLTALKKSAQLCEHLGHTVEPAVLKIDHEEVSKAFLILISAETASDLKFLMDIVGRKPKHNELERQTAVVCEVGYHFTAADYAWASQILDVTARRVAEFFLQYDVMLTPAMAGPPPLIGQFKPDRVEQTMLELLRWVPRRQLLLKFMQRAGARNFGFTPFTPLFNISGNPAMSVPLYQDQNNLPIGIQFVGRMGEEATLLQLANQLEQAKPWALKSKAGVIRKETAQDAVPA
jgi:amidase